MKQNKNILRDWMSAASASEKAELARLAQTTVGTLRQLAGAYRTQGHLRVEADLARRIELAAGLIHRPGLPVLCREHLSPACANCEFVPVCRNSRAG